MDPIRIVSLKLIQSKFEIQKLEGRPSQKKVGQPRPMRPSGFATYEPT